jgi:hypothetical protein
LPVLRTWTLSSTKRNPRLASSLTAVASPVFARASADVRSDRGGFLLRLCDAVQRTTVSVERRAAETSAETAAS